MGLALLLGAAGLPGSPALPGIGPDDPRVMVNAGDVPWRAVGRVQTELGGRCTGFLIGPHTAMTAAHCLFVFRAGNYLQPSSVHFVVGLAFGTFAGQARVVSYSIGDGYDPTQEGRTAGADWALLQLDTPLGVGDRVLPLLRRPLAAGERVTLGGYDRDRQEVMQADPDCKVTGRVGALLAHNCAGTSGTSGAPLLYRAPDGTWWAAGIQVVAAIGRAGGMAVGAWTIPK